MLLQLSELNTTQQSDNKEEAVMPPKTVTLTTEAFQEALVRFIDETKPDRLARNQLECWTIEWENDFETTFEDELLLDQEYDNVSNNSLTSDSVIFTHRIQGVLTIQGEYVTVQLCFYCAWGHKITDTTTTSLFSSKQHTDGMLLYSCRVHSAKFSDRLTNNNDNKTERKIRQKMMQRLKKDSYLAKLLAVGKSSSNNNSNINPQPSGAATHTTTVSSLDPVLAKARIHVDQTKHILEERVDVSDMVAEALRRAVWSSSESSLDLIELIMALPSLPGTRHQVNNKEYQCIETSPLADRAKLRLLEDAMLDECEKEGEGELIQELTIDPGDDTDEPQRKAKGNDAPQRKKKKSKSKS
jgi:hypothetical protein